MEDYIEVSFKMENLMARARSLKQPIISMKETGNMVTTMDGEFILGKIKSKFL